MKNQRPTRKPISTLGALLFPAYLLGVGCGDDGRTANDELGDTSATDDSESGNDGENDGESGDQDGETDDTDTEGPECGNGIVEGDEECDDANLDDADGCTSQCVAAVCGDGIQQPGEGCDAGRDNGPGMACNDDCTPNVCGDGEVGPGEACDDGNLDDTDDCGNDCALLTCGDGIVDPAEVCDDGNADNLDACLNTCMPASCGDEFLYPIEETCDLGPLNSDSAECTFDCEAAVCGDSLVWVGQEECDLGVANNGPSAACLTDCVLNICGDGFKSLTEGCDDGNLLDDDGCTLLCQFESCGDGVLNGLEDCDDGNLVDDDGCSLCQFETCGDAIINGLEDCDDGNLVDDDTCTNACELGFFGSGLPVELGTAGEFAILAKSGISTVPASAVTGDIGVSPAAATYITGFSLIADPSNVFSTSTQVTGQVYAADYAVPTPSNMTTAISDMELAYTDAAGRPPDVTELGAGNIGGMNLPAGVYKWGTGLLIPTDVTLSGNATDVWIFQIAQDLTVSNGADISLSGGAVPENVFWQVAGFVEFGTTAHGEGIVLTQTAITLKTGASINGRLMAQTAVDIAMSTVVQPAQ